MVKKSKGSDNESSERSAELKKRLPGSYERIKLNQIAINSKQLINASASKKSETKPVMSRQTSLISQSKMKVGPRVVKKRTVIRRLPAPQNESPKAVTDNLDRPDANKSFTSQISSRDKRQMEKDAVDSLIKLSESQTNKLERSKAIQSSSNVSFSIDKKTSEALNSSIVSSTNKTSPRSEPKGSKKQRSKPPVHDNMNKQADDTTSEQSSTKPVTQVKSEKTDKPKKEPKKTKTQVQRSPETSSLTSKVNKSALLRRLSRGSIDMKRSTGQQFGESPDVYSGEDESSPAPPPTIRRNREKVTREQKTDADPGAPELSSGKQTPSDAQSSEMKALTSMDLVDVKNANLRETSSSSTMSAADKSKKYFEYMYSLNGNSGLPRRVSSGNYVVTFDNRDENADQRRSSQQSDLRRRSSTKRYEIEESTLLNIDGKPSDWNTIESRHYYDWLRNHEDQKSRLRDRLLSAKQNQEDRIYDNLRRWSTSIERKNSIRKSSVSTLNRPILPFSPSPTNKLSGGNQYESSSLNYDSTGETGAKEIANIFALKHSEREIKSATITPRRSKFSVLGKGRPKSVSFFFDKQLNNDHQLINRFNVADEGEKPAPPQQQEAVFEEGTVVQNLIVQPSYLVSQIEMEEILQEVEKRVKSASETNNKYHRTDSQMLSEEDSDSSFLDHDKPRQGRIRKRSFSPAKTNTNTSPMNRQSTMGSVQRSDNVSSMTTSASRQQKHARPSNQDEFHTSHR